MAMASHRSRIEQIGENADSLILDVKCLHKGWGGKIEFYLLCLVSHEVEMVASLEIFAFSVSVGKWEQLRASCWKRITCVAFLGSLTHSLNKFRGSALDGSNTIV